MTKPESAYSPNSWEKRMNHYRYWYMDLLLIVILLAGGYLRFVGISWDEDQHLHPDERFLTMVENNMSPVDSISDYFNTDQSTLNPHNVGHSFYVYGDLPIIVTRYLAEWTGMNSYDTVHVLGREISATLDLLTVLMVFLIGKKVYDRRIGLLASAFYSLAVIPIQLSHFFAVDTFLCFFTSLAIYAAVSIYQEYREQDEIEKENPEEPVNTWRAIGYYLLFGTGLALAMASKVSAAPLAVILPVAVACWYLKQPGDKQMRWFIPLFRNMAFAAAFAFLLFRIFQPYAFAGPSFFNIELNPKFIQNLNELKGQTSGGADFPPALQWARRTHLFAFENLTLWGTGLPLGILGWLAFLFMGYRMFKQEWQIHLPVWLWTAAYFAWQSLAWNPMMRYTYLIYPTFCVMAAWIVFRIWDYRKIMQVAGFNGNTAEILLSGQVSALKPEGSDDQSLLEEPDPTLPEALTDIELMKSIPSVDETEIPEAYLTQPVWTRVLAGILAIVVLAGSGVWAYAFTRIYTRPVTRIAASRWIYQNVPGPVNLKYSTIDGDYNQPIPYPSGSFIIADNPLAYDFNAAATGTVQTITFFRIGDAAGVEGEKELVFTITDAENNTVLNSAVIKSTFLSATDTRGDTYEINFQEPIKLVQGHRYNIRFDLIQGNALLTVSGSAPANESDWDDGLPLRIDNYDGFGGIYDGTLNFQMYWEEDTDKRDRFITTLDAADYIFISSNRQWATTVRVPERYPLSTLYYSNLVGCPENMDILVCFAEAQPGLYQGNLGFDLIQVFESDPGIGSFTINDQLAEESFTVYDHPKVLIFKKSEEYDPKKISELFNSVDLNTVIHSSLSEVPSHPQNLMLPTGQLEAQRAGGTWSELFNREAFYNTNPGLAVVFWYVVLFLLGLMMQPLVHLAFPGFRDRGYAFGRMTAMLVLALITWWAGSSGIPVTRISISVVVGLLVVVNVVLGWFQRTELKEYFRKMNKHILITEAVILIFFLLDLGIRIGNPDLWHASKGGEKPMDFAYLNAILKSTTFPPYDPWYSGGYINYYYYGFVIVGVLVKWLGIIPSIAYNIILPTLFSLLAVGAFCIIYNVAVRSEEDHPAGENSLSPYWFAVAAALGLAVLGNLGTIRMIWYGLQQLAAPDGVISTVGTTLITRIIWTFQGIIKFVQGANLPYNIGEWYWNPSRVIPALNDTEPITEFPFFTFLYADLHAHMIALPVTITVLGWLISVVMSKGRWGTGKNRLAGLGLLVSLFVGATAVGALKPTNTWDFPVYLVLAGLSLVYVFFRYKTAFLGGWLDKINPRWLKGLLVLGVFGGLTLLLYKPFSDWYGAGYTSVTTWTGSHTPVWSYLTHWGIFLFFIVTWLFQETIDWMDKTPLKKLAYLRSYSDILILLVVLFIAAITGITLLGISIAWLVIPIALWAALLIFRPDQSDLKRLFLFFVGTGLFLTLFVEVMVLKGDIGRMNTVFKFYLQVWSLFAVTSAAALYWVCCDRVYWRAGYTSGFQTIAWFLLLCGVLFPFTGAASKIRDRFTSNASHSLDGSSYMLDATYLEHDINFDTTMTMELEQDYQGIRWMQDNVSGSPVIVEGSDIEYKWGSRYSIYTGLPSVVGWNWHQRQQRGVANPVWVQDRVNEVNNFYSINDIDATLKFIRQYDVKYIIVGQMERAIYPLSGLVKFKAYSDIYWKPVYTYKSVTIYEVLPEKP